MSSCYHGFPINCSKNRKKNQLASINPHLELSTVTQFWPRGTRQAHKRILNTYSQQWLKSRNQPVGTTAKSHQQRRKSYWNTERIRPQNELSSDRSEPGLREVNDASRRTMALILLNTIRDVVNLKDNSLSFAHVWVASIPQARWGEGSQNAVSWLIRPHAPHRFNSRTSWTGKLAHHRSTRRQHRWRITSHQST